MKQQTKLKSRLFATIAAISLLGAVLINVSAANAQARVRPDIEESSEVRIYRSLEELLADKADTVIAMEYLMVPAEFGVVHYHLMVTKKEGKKIGRVYGFKIGDETFINPANPKLRKRKIFYKTERIGGYINYASVGVIWFAPGRGLPPYRVTYPREELVRMDDAKRLHLTRGRLKKILKEEDNLTLWEEFKTETRKSEKIIAYLKWHEEKKEDS